MSRNVDHLSPFEHGYGFITYMSIILTNITQWVNEISYFFDADATAQLVLVGTHVDRRIDGRTKWVSTKEV